MSELMKWILGAILGSSFLSTVVTLAHNDKKDKKDKENGMGKGVQLLLLIQIKSLGKELLSQDCVTLEDLQLFNEMYDVYKSMGGNGYAEIIHNKVNALKVVVEERDGLSI